MLIKSLVAILALCQTTLAFFMWFPEYRCIEDHTCTESGSKRSAEPAVPGIIGFELTQKLPNNDVSHEVQIRRLASRLARKYQRGSPVQNFDEGGVQKRDGHNAYNIVSAAIPTQSDSAGIDQDGTDFSYFTSVTLGTSNTKYHMLLDTGAGQTWIMGDTCTSTACEIHNSYGPDESTTYQTVSGSFNVGYGTGSVSGMLATDDVSFAGIKVSMTFGVANTTSKDFVNFPIDGILGLNQGKSDFPNFLQTLVTSKLLKSNIFGVSLNRMKDGPNNGAINFGAPDTSRFSNSLSYTPVSSNGEGDWAIPIDDLGVGDQKTGISDTLAYIDTGTSFIFCPTADAKKFHSLIPGSTSTDGVTYYVPCTTTDSAFFTFSGVTYQVSSEDWVGGMVNGQCTSNIYGMAVVPDSWLLGDTFLKNVYAVFDIDQNRVGFGAAKGASSVTSSATPSPTGGPNSLSTLSSAALSSSASASIGPSTGPTSTTLGTQSNGSPTGSSSAGPSPTAAAATSTTASSDSSASGSPGLNGHQTDSSAGTAAAETSSTSTTASPSTTKKSSAARLDIFRAESVLVLLALITLLT